MALSACPECSKEISTEATQCPHCGFKKRSTPILVKILAWGVGGFVALVVVGAMLPRPESKPGSMASFECAAAVRQHLRDPDTAEFLNEQDDNSSSRLADGSYISMLKVRAANGFGGKSLETFTCTLNEAADKSWRLEHLAEIGPDGAVSVLVN